MAQTGAVFKIGETYLRMKDSGNIFPIHEEQEKLVKKELADFVRCVALEDGEYQFEVVKSPEANPEPKKISTPARRPELPVAKPAVKTAEPPKIDLSV